MLSTEANFCKIKFCRRHDARRLQRRIHQMLLARFAKRFGNLLTFKTFIFILLAVTNLYFEFSN